MAIRSTTTGTRGWQPARPVPNPITKPKNMSAPATDWMSRIRQRPDGVAPLPSFNTGPARGVPKTGGVAPLPQIGRSQPQFSGVSGRRNSHPWYQNLGPDDRIKSDEGILGRIAAIRQNRGMDADDASDQIWFNRIKGGKATFGDVRQRLDEASGSQAHTAKSWGIHAGANTELPSLSAADFADLAARRRNASRGLEEALARRQAGEATIGAGHDLLLKQLQEKFAGARTNMMNDFGGRGLAFQPRFAGKGQRDLRNAHASERGAAEVDKAARLSQLAQMVADARRTRDGELALVDADTVRRKADLSRLIQQIGA